MPDFRHLPRHGQVASPSYRTSSQEQDDWATPHQWEMRGNEYTEIDIDAIRPNVPAFSNEARALAKNALADIEIKARFEDVDPQAATKLRVKLRCLLLMEADKLITPKEDVEEQAHLKKQTDKMLVELDHLAREQGCERQMDFLLELGIGAINKAHYKPVARDR